MGLPIRRMGNIINLLQNMRRETSWRQTEFRCNSSFKLSGRWSASGPTEFRRRHGAVARSRQGARLDPTAGGLRTTEARSVSSTRHWLPSSSCAGLRGSQRSRRASRRSTMATGLTLINISHEIRREKSAAVTGNGRHGESGRSVAHDGCRSRQGHTSGDDSAP